MADAGVVVVGAGLGAIRLAENLRTGGYSGPVTLVGAEAHPPYDRPPLSKSVLLGKDDRVDLKPAEFYDDSAITLRLSTRVVAVDPAAHTVTVESVDAPGATETVPYDTLVLATGLDPRPFPGAPSDLAGVHTLRTVDDEARWLGGDEIAAADEDSPERQKAAARKGGARTHRDAPVYDVEAEGGLAEAQDPHLGARLSPSDPRAGAGDLTASMRARQASRGRGRSSSQRSSGGAGTTSATSRATQLPASMAPTERTERIDVGTTPPPLPSHPRPEELTESGEESREAPVNTAGGERDSSGRDGDAVTSDAVTTSAAGSGADARGVTGASDDDSHAGAQSDDTNSETSRHEDVDEASGKAARGSRRRKSRRPRARVEQASVRGALRDDDDEHDESLFGELPGHHDGGDVYEDDAIGAEHDGEHEFDDVATDSSAEFDDEVAAQAENESSDDAEKSASAADEETSGTDTREAAPTKNDTTSRDASSKGTSKGASPAVPPRASQSRKSSRPSVPSWDDIMFGGRGPKK